MRRHRQAKHLAPKTCGHDKTTSTMAGGHEELINVVDFLVAKAAEERQQ